MTEITAETAHVASVYLLLDDGDACEVADCSDAATHAVEVALTDGGTKLSPLCAFHALAFVDFLLTIADPSE